MSAGDFLGANVAISELSECATTLGRWYCVHTQPEKESFAQRNLIGQGVVAFCPMQRRTIRHARKKINVLRPLFPRYLFVHLDVDGDHWHKVNRTFGVSSLVMTGDEPTPVPEGVVECLMDTADPRGVVSERSLEAFDLGEEIQVRSGPFSGHVARVHQLDDRGRVCLLLSIMGGSVSVWAPPSDLSRAS